MKSEEKSISEDLIYVRAERMKKEVRSIKSGKMPEELKLKMILPCLLKIQLYLSLIVQTIEVHH